jgi:hypothetical protein
VEDNQKKHIKISFDCLKIDVVNYPNNIVV